MRNSANPEAGTLRFTAAEWVAFVGGVRDGDFDFGLIDQQSAAAR